MTKPYGQQKCPLLCLCQYCDKPYIARRTSQVNCSRKCQLKAYRSRIRQALDAYKEGVSQ